MISFVKTLAGVLAALWFLPLSIPAQAETGAFSVHRAINMARWFTWPRYEAAGGGIQWPPYKEASRPDDLDTLKALREVGFDTVRLPVDPAPFIVFQAEQRIAVYEMLFATIERIRAAGLKVIVDIHPNSKHPVWGQNAVIAGMQAPAFRAVADVVEDMARRLKNHTADVALELLNEPVLKCRWRDQALWEEMQQHLVMRARGANPKLTLIATGACTSSAEGLMALDPRPIAGPNMIYTFHFYEPFSFTHQGAQFIPWPDKYLDGVPWPSGARPISEPRALTERQITLAGSLSYAERITARVKAMHNLERYYADEPGPGFIDRRFRGVAQWAQRHGIDQRRIFIGEFGVLRREPGKPGAFCEDRARWHRDVRRAADAYGFSWAYFNYDGQFGLVPETGGRQFDPVILDSLGLKSPCAVVGLSATSPVSDAGSEAGAMSCPARCPSAAGGQPTGAAR